MKYLAVLLLTPSLLLAQGPETPPGPPGPTQKSLQEIWDRVELLETDSSARQAVVTDELVALKADLARSEERVAELSVRNQQLAGLIANLSVPLPWTVTPLHSGSSYLSDAISLDYDSHGNPAVAFTEVSGGSSLLLARRVRGIWSSEDVTAGNLLRDLSLDFGPEDIPAISYRRWPTNTLYVASTAMTPWTGEVDDGGANAVGQYSSLKFDHSGNPVVAYQDATAEDLKIASYNGSSWIIENWSADTTDDEGRYLSLAISPDNIPWVVHYEPTGERLKVSYRTTPSVFNSNPWSGQVISPGGSLFSSDIAFNPQGRPCIVDNQNGVISFRKKLSNGNWTTEQVDPNGGAWLHLEFNLLGQPVIGYVRDGQVRIATSDGMAWDIDTVTETSDVTAFAFALGPDGQPSFATAETDGVNSEDGILFYRRELFSP